jgi:hypothetical protein
VSAGSGTAAGGGGMPQFAMPGRGGGKRSARIWPSSSDTANGGGGGGPSGGGTGAVDVLTAGAIAAAAGVTRGWACTRGGLLMITGPLPALRAAAPDVSTRTEEEPRAAYSLWAARRSASAAGPGQRERGASDEGNGAPRRGRGGAHIGWGAGAPVLGVAVVVRREACVRVVSLCADMCIRDASTGLA